MKVEVNLPRAVIVSDYHDFDALELNLRTLIKDIKVKEIVYHQGKYIGMIYTGHLLDPENEKLSQALTKLQKSS